MKAACRHRIMPLLWMFCLRTMNRKMNYIHERALRLVYTDYSKTFSELLREDKSVSFHHRNIHNLAIEMFKVKNHLSPLFMKEIFSYNETINRFVYPKVRTDMGKLSLRSFGPVVWNTMLPESIKSSENINIFKERIKLWIPDNCQCRLCSDWVDGVGFWKISH